ncbi:hypothetical protein O181_015843 [Austropuccinia psidii MF-1]|uniref:Uncharacterized protein n=1 Tax=Austropuccinia psidii MF-1 TaxID=1389203 RepID=A0A9Q3C400_9BASI|nr:hypothetical protein [Austropuccinia psidii MF-1]
MNFNNYHQSDFPQANKSSSETSIKQIVKQQTQKIQQLEAKLQSREHALESLLSKFNIQEAGTSKGTRSENSKGKQHQHSSISVGQPKLQNTSSQNTLRNTSNEKSKIPQMVKQTVGKQFPNPPLPRKRNQHQLLNIEIPEGFQPTKKAFYEHIKMLWGLIYQHPIPISPDYSMLKEFNCRFSFLKEITAHSENTNIPPLVPLEEILTLRNMKPGKKKFGTSIIHMSDFSIKFIISLLAKLGIRRWAPDLEDASDTLYNEACRISAIQTFRQISIGGAYEFMNVNFTYLQDLQLLTKVYNHYVHWYMAQRYKKEAKESGKYAKDEERRAILRGRLKLKNVRYRFAVVHEFPQRYLKVLANPDAHSDDELDANSNKYMIKKVECRSEKANQFMRRIDEEIEKAQNAERKGNQRRQRHMPADGMASISKYAPKGLPIDFYDPDWYNNRTAGQKRSFADSYNVAFLPDASKSLLGNQHPDERLSDKRFTQKYWEEVIEAYDISHEMVNDDNVDDSIANDSEDLEYLNEETIDEANSINQANNDQGELSHLEDLDTEMEYVGDDDVTVQSHNTFFTLPNEWS